MAEPVIFLYRDPKMGLGMIRMIDDLRLDELSCRNLCLNLMVLSGFSPGWIYGRLWFWYYTEKS